MTLRLCASREALFNRLHDPHVFPRRVHHASKVNRRRFLRNAGTGIAAGVAASASVSALAAETSPPAIPLPDANTAKPAPGTGQQTVCCTPAAKPIYRLFRRRRRGRDRRPRRPQADRGRRGQDVVPGRNRRPDTEPPGDRPGAQVILAIDGCPMHCARNTLEKAGFTKFEHVCLADLGMAKGKTPATAEAVAKVASVGKKRLGG